MEALQQLFLAPLNHLLRQNAWAGERLARHRGQCSGGVGVREVFAGRLTNIYNVETHIGAGAIRPHFLYMAA